MRSSSQIKEGRQVDKKDVRDGSNAEKKSVMICGLVRMNTGQTGGDEQEHLVTQ